MKYIITFFWALLISQVTMYLGAQLTQMTYKLEHGLFLGIVATITVILVSKILPPVQKDTHEPH